MTKLLIDYQPPLIIDVGANKIKYSQSNLNTYTISKNIRKEKEEKSKKKAEKVDEKSDAKISPIGDTPTTEGEDNRVKKDIKKGDGNTDLKKINPTLTTNDPGEDYFEEKEVYINPDSVFDCNKYINEFPTILTYFQREEDEDFKKILKWRKKLNPNDIKSLLEKLDKYGEIKKDSNIVAFHSDEKPADIYSYHSNRFDHEKIWGGVIEDFNYWNEVLALVGEQVLGRQNFVNNSFQETPVIITQNSLPYSQKKNQIQSIYEYLFEERKCPYVLICSQALLNLLSHNLSSGIVLDFGESKTSFTCINNGHTQYDNCLTSNFMSGRNISALRALYTKINSEENKEEVIVKDKNKPVKLTYEEILKAQYEKEDRKDDQLSFLVNSENDETNFTTKLSAYNYLYTYPEVFRMDLNPTVSVNDIFFSALLDNRIQFIISKKRIDSRTVLDFWDEKSKNFKEMKFNDFEQMYINKYLNCQAEEFEPVEKTICRQEGGFVNKDECKYFRQLSYSHILVSQLEHIIHQDEQNGKKYANIVFSGGVLNTTGIKDVLRKDLTSMTNNGNNPGSYLNLYFPNDDEKDTSIAFYKGANYLTKLPDLENIMITKENYMDHGVENLTYFFV